MIACTASWDREGFLSFQYEQLREIFANTNQGCFYNFSRFVYDRNQLALCQYLVCDNSGEHGTFQVLRESNRSRWACLTWRCRLLLLLLLLPRVGSEHFSDNTGIVFYLFGLGDMPSQFLEGHFIFMVLMSFSRLPSPLGERKGVGGKAEIRLCLKTQLVQRCHCWVKLREEATLWKPVIQLHISANHWLMSRGICWFWDWLLAITDKAGGKKKNSSFFWDFCQYGFNGWHTECLNCNI